MRRWSRAAALVVVLGALGTRAARATVFLAEDEALKLAFPDADRIEDRTFVLTDEQKQEVEKRAHAALESQLWTIHVGWKGNEIRGYAIIDSHVVRTLPETFMVVLDPAGTIRRVEVLAFHEPPEYLPTARWVGQFEGRKLSDDLTLNGAIQGITGATLSATAMTAGVRRALALFAVVVKPGASPAPAPPSANGTASPGASGNAAPGANGPAAPGANGPAAPAAGVTPVRSATGGAGSAGAGH